MDQNNGRLEIITFGSFDILIDGDSLLTQFGKSQKALSLLKYFISNRGKKIPVNRIIEANFKLYDYTDYNNALRSQVHIQASNLYILLCFLVCELGFLVHCYSLYSRIV